MRTPHRVGLTDIRLAGNGCLLCLDHGLALSPGKAFSIPHGSCRSRPAHPQLQAMLAGNQQIDAVFFLQDGRLA